MPSPEQPTGRAAHRRAPSETAPRAQEARPVVVTLRPRVVRRTSSRWRTALYVVVAAGLTIAAVAGALAVRDGEGGQRWKDGSAHGPWLAVFDGQGRTTYDDGVITLSPEVATSPDRTHAGLVVSMRQYGSVDYAVSMHTVRQLRQTRPNPWEAGWVVWHYSSNDRFYYFTLKPNGWELGKADPRFPGSQRFLATGEQPSGIDDRRRVRVRQVGNDIDVWVDDLPVVRFSDLEDPYLSGSVGIYAEDAEVRFDDFAVRAAAVS